MENIIIKKRNIVTNVFTALVLINSVGTGLTLLGLIYSFVLGKDFFGDQVTLLNILYALYIFSINTFLLFKLIELKPKVIFWAKIVLTLELLEIIVSTVALYFKKTAPTGDLAIGALISLIVTLAVGLLFIKYLKRNFDNQL